MFTTLAISVFLLFVLTFLLGGKDPEKVGQNPILGCVAVFWLVALLAFLGSGVGVIIQLIN